VNTQLPILQDRFFVTTEHTMTGSVAPRKRISTSGTREPAAAAAAAAAPAPAPAPAPAAASAAALDFSRESPYQEHPFSWPWHLFFNEKFSVHRVLGLVYLLQYAQAWRLYATDYAAFAASPFLWTLPLNGVLQSLTATYYFSFLPSKSDPGYYSDKSALSFTFVKENIFYSSILAWQWVYMNAAFFGPGSPADGAAPAARPGLVLALSVVEHAWTFLPYLLFRNLVPKTSFRDSLSNDKNKSQVRGPGLILHGAQRPICAPSTSP